MNFIKLNLGTIGERNRNGRVYPRQIWESEVRNYQTVLESGSINTLMEYEHPSPSLLILGKVTTHNQEE